MRTKTPRSTVRRLQIAAILAGFGYQLKRPGRTQGARYLLY
jgi:hypothetical protein